MKACEHYFGIKNQKNFTEGFEDDVRAAFKNSPEGKQAAELAGQIEKLQAKKNDLNVQVEKINTQIDGLKDQKSKLHDKWSSRAARG